MTEEKKDIKVPEKFKKLVEEIEKMNVMDLAELVKILEEKFDVSPMAAAPVMTGGLTSGTGEGVKEEKTVFNLELKNAGAQKIQVIKVLREITGLGLKEAKDLADGAPKIIKENLKKEEAEEMKKKLEEAGAVVELK
ncbi:MAG: 50S ribosomal protein L7/L12 [Candidatus Portnoybacteria bacterium RBG_13_40_8]|uniref:Large ribosomal subunit protein bL12 n=1 Tax=Candidatus Portnoybacteria bacterium RBG_13_40_8 TaxID=1801990 RepID=A0A1G2F5F0_9BACT|nr:MAG: 50S ribosomal protein L7/L12 [Candidatus Portnoybacteria bacterium RBG_13_40_8]OGZ34985.1 MAG: 50S ribosomal protein L7/L12 [Candidatus Portnoybacteria bacterium RIFCSPHIGHO2_01_FULL_39_19]